MTDSKHILIVDTDRAAAEALTKKISGTYITVQMLAGEDEKLFGSVTTQDIQAELQKMGIAVDKKAIHIHEPIRKLGGHEAVIKPHADFSAKLKIQVIRKK
jgi:large subunit ribosomal protein L9